MSTITFTSQSEWSKPPFVLGETVTTAPSRQAILDYIVGQKSALTVSQAGDMLRVCSSSHSCQDGPTEELEHLEGPEYITFPNGEALESPLLLDAQTANVMRMCRACLKPENQAKFDRLPWARAASIAWGIVK